MVTFVLTTAMVMQFAAADGFLGVKLMAHDDTGKPVVVEIVKGSPAEKAKLQVDDEIVKLDGQAVLSVEDLIEKVRKTKPDTEVTITVKRGKDTKEIKVIPFGGRREVYGFNGLVMGRLDDPYIRATSLKRCIDQGYGHKPSK